jgi:hypothetical protein
MSIGIKANVAGIGIPASSILVQYRSTPVPDWVSLFRYRIGSGVGGIFFLPITPKNSASVNKNKLDTRQPNPPPRPPAPNAEFYFMALYFRDSGGGEGEGGGRIHYKTLK